MKNLIEKRIKELYGSKGEFAEHVGIKPKNLSSKLKAVEKKFNDLSEFLQTLGIDLEAKEKKLRNLTLPGDIEQSIIEELKGQESQDVEVYVNKIYFSEYPGLVEKMNNGKYYMVFNIDFDTYTVHVVHENGNAYFFHTSIFDELEEMKQRAKDIEETETYLNINR